MEVEDATRNLKTKLHLFDEETQAELKIVLSKLEKFEKFLSDEMIKLAEFDDAKKFLESLLLLPLSYTEEEEPFIKKLNVAVKVLRDNPAVWYNTNDLPHEIWRDVIGYEGLYKVSNYGRFKSFHRGKISILKTTLKAQGYMAVKLFKENTRKTCLAHRLVAQAFLPNPKQLPIVNHRDNVHFNNVVCNLEWTTFSENTKHAFQIGAAKPLVGIKNPNTKLSDAEVKFIRKNYKPNDKRCGARPLAEEFGVTPSTICDIVKGRTRRTQR